MPEPSAAFFFLESPVPKILRPPEATYGGAHLPGDIEKLNRQIAKATERLLLIDDDLLGGVRAGRTTHIADGEGDCRRSMAADEVLRQASPVAARQAPSRIVGEMPRLR